jgi:N-acetylmuramoyl-L-alanine amidase
MTDLKIKPIQSLKKICLHWTAGPGDQTEADFTHYHYTVGKEGVIKDGKCQPSANIPPLTNGHYAAHCGGGNSWCIGVALCGMVGYTGPGKVGPYPLTEKQGEAAWEFIAKLCKQHGIPVTSDTVFTHYEFGRKHPESDSAGKIDITHLPYRPELKADEVGDYIRGKVRWYLSRLNSTVPGGKA